MLHKRILLFVSVATFLFTSCDFTPSVINEPDCKVFAACAVQPNWVSNELYHYVMQVYEKSLFGGNNAERGDIIFEEGDEMWNLNLLRADGVFAKSYCIYNYPYYGYIGNNYNEFSNRELINFLTSPKNFSKNDYPYRDEELQREITEYDGDPYSGHSCIGQRTIYFYNHNRAIRTIYEICGGDLMPFKEELCKDIEVYDYREDEMSSTNRVTVYDVVYKVNGETYVWCSVSDMGDKTFEINLVNSSNMFSDLGF